MANEIAATLEGQQSSPRKTDIVAEIFSSAALLPVVIVAFGLGILYWPILSTLPTTWLGPDSLYSHGPLVPLLAAMIIWMNRARFKDIPVKGSVVGLLLLIPIFYGTFVASRTVMWFAMSAFLLMAVPACILFIAGWRWMLALLPATLYNSFCLPLWKALVDASTQPLQRYSTEMAYQLLKASGLGPIRSDATVITLDHYTLNVAVACSGSKLTLSLLALSMFFVLAYRPRIWGSLFMIALVVPLALLVNGFRIALIGVVGNAFGESVGQQFHDYGGYIALIVCMLILRSFVRLVGVTNK